MEKFQVPPFYQGYVSLAGEGDILEGLEKNKVEVIYFFNNLPQEKFDYRYAAGKWSVKEVLQHITDTERIMAYRALRISRGDKTPLAGFEQDDYVNALKIDHLGKEDMLAEWSSVRLASTLLFKNMDPSLFHYEGTANNNPLNVDLLGRIIYGHTRHHLKILKERYLKK